MKKFSYLFICVYQRAQLFTLLLCPAHGLHSHFIHVSAFHSHSPQEIQILPLLAGQFFLIFNAKLFPSYSFLTTSPRQCGSYASLKVAYRTRGDWYLPILKCKHLYSIENSGVYCVVFSGVTIFGKNDKSRR